MGGSTGRRTAAASTPTPTIRKVGSKPPPIRWGGPTACSTISPIASPERGCGTGARSSSATTRAGISRRSRRRAAPAHTFTYRPDDLAQSYVPPSLGGGTWATGYGYSLDGQLTAVARPTGDSGLFAYDPTNGRPTGVSFSRGTLGSGSLTYGYSGTTGA